MTTLLARGQITIAAIKDGADGKPGKDGVSVSVVSTTVEYQISSSATSAPQSGWSTTVKQATDAQPYLWSRTVVKYSDGKSTTTYGVAYKGKNGTNGKDGAVGPQGPQGPQGEQGVQGPQGATGPTGADGKDGTSVSVKSTSVTYAVTNSNSKPTDSAFTNTTMPNVAVGQYLWSKTEVVYTDGKSTKSYSVSRIGTDGAKGMPGANGKTTHFAYATSADGKTGFSTTLFAGATYIGTYDDNKIEDSSIYTDYKWTKLKGDTGDRGPQGPTGAAGKDAVSASFSPAALTFSATTDSNGNAQANTTSGNTATITMLEGSKEVTGTYSITSMVGCTAVISGKTVTVKSIASDTIEGRAISRTSASVTVKCEYNGKTCYVDLPISVSVSAVWGGLVTSQKELKSSYTKLQSDLSGSNPNILNKYTSTIKQSAKEISLKVSQTAVGRKNLLVGSDFRKQSDKWAGNDSYRPYISVLDQYNGHNSVVLENGANTYHGLDFFRVPVKTGKYTAGVMAKFNGKPESGSFAIYVARKDADDQQIGNNSWIPVDVSNVVVGQWSLYSTSFDIEDKCKLIDLCFIYTNNPTAWFAQPMLVEGDEYVGWSLSEEDAEYIGGNLLDNTDTLVQGGNLVVASGNLYTDANSYKGFPTRQVNLLESTSAFLGILQWDLSNDGVLTVGQDYMLSFWAKGNIGGKFVAYFYKDGNQVVYTEVLDRVDGPNQHQAADGNAGVVFKEDYVWKQYWVHWRVVGSNLPKYVQIRCMKGCDLYVSQPKLEYGATVTEYRATKTDFVEDKSVAGKLLDAGIDIDSREITMTADKTKFRTQTGQEVAVFDENGLNAKLIRAQKLEAIGLDHSRVLIESGLAQFFGTNGVCNIRVGVDNTGCSVLQFFNSNGLMTYDLGPSGLNKISITKSTLTSSRYYDMLAAGCTSPIGTNKVFRSAIAGQEVSAYVASKKNDTVLFGNKGVGTFPITAGQYLVTLYSYTAPTVNGVIQADPDHGLTTKALAEAANGKMFKSKTMVVNGAIANLADGNYIPQNNSSSIKDGEDYFNILWNTEGDYIECPSFCVPGITTINKGLKGFYQTVFSIDTKWIYQNNSGLHPVDPPTRPT